MLQELFFVDLSYNSLNGTIPSYNLPLLSLLWLNHNQLSGSFPQSLVNLTNLSTLDLSSNNITIDEGINITFPSLEVLKLSSCERKDFPHFLRNVKTLQWIYVGISSHKLQFWTSCWNCMWSLMFKYRKPKWFVEIFDGLMPHKRRRPKKRAQRGRT
ncbi:hypothetical protein H5410_057268 [Solanum commersonii]|uniref:Uncharacterized protein n=1 Tax=Solanum commersonii TaxID=4109 RepID=A0A9J5WQD6_SOLCO|nr:hypothetical protein H5410_057268 [Solanum commersonii]